MDFDIIKSKQFFVDASHHTVGDDHLLRSEFRMRLPEICALTDKGFSFEQIAELFEQCGLKLRTSTAEQYYREHLIEKMEKCVLMMDEQIERILQLSKTTGDKIETKEVVPVTPAGTQLTTAFSPNEDLHCLALLPVKPLGRRDGVPEAVYMDGQMEHPAISGLMLSKDERIYGTYLEIVAQNGETRLETVHEKIFRIKWVKPIPRTETATGANFVKMDYSLFENISNHKRPQ
jgi:hypothetical protein